MSWGWVNNDPIFTWSNYSFKCLCAGNDPYHICVSEKGEKGKTCASVTLGCDDMTSFMSSVFSWRLTLFHIYMLITQCHPLVQRPVVLTVLFNGISIAPSLSFSPTLEPFNHTDLIRRKAKAHIATGHFHYHFLINVTAQPHQTQRHTCTATHTYMQRMI